MVKDVTKNNSDLRDLECALREVLAEGRDMVDMLERVFNQHFGSPDNSTPNQSDDQ